jgi:chemotaxis protein CheC
LELTAKQRDTLTELINIAYARAAGALSDLTGHRITLAVPDVTIRRIDSVTPALQEVIEGEITCVNQFFGGAISGNAVLLFDRPAALVLTRLLTGNPKADVYDESSRDTMIEVGNIVLNACLGAFGNLMHVNLKFTVPHLQVDEIENVLRSIRIQDQKFEYAMMIRTRFDLRASDVSGFLVILFGITSLERVFDGLRKWG